MQREHSKLQIKIIDFGTAHGLSSAPDYTVEEFAFPGWRSVNIPRHTSQELSALAIDNAFEGAATEEGIHLLKGETLSMEVTAHRSHVGRPPNNVFEYRETYEVRRAMMTVVGNRTRRVVKN